MITGNTAIDALQYTVNPDYHHDLLQQLNPAHRTILLTMHRRENQGEKMEEALTAIRQVVEERGDVDLVYPVHLSPAVQEVATASLTG